MSPDLGKCGVVECDYSVEARLVGFQNTRNLITSIRQLVRQDTALLTIGLPLPFDERYARMFNASTEIELIIPSYTPYDLRRDEGR